MISCISRKNEFGEKMAQRDARRTHGPNLEMIREWNQQIFGRHQFNSSRKHV